MLKFDADFLRSVGMPDLPDRHQSAVRSQAYKTLELRVGVALAARMSDDQLAVFEQYVDRNDDKGAFAWLEENLPDYKSVVNEKYEQLRAEILAASQEVRDVLAELLPLADSREDGEGDQDSSEPALENG